MSRFGLNLWSPNSELFVMGVMGMCISTAENPLYSIGSDIKEVWNMDLPSDKFSSGLQYFLRLILVNVIIVRALTVHFYILTFILNTWPIFLEEQAWMLLPWLLLGLVKNIVLEVVVLLVGSFMFMRYGSPFKPVCFEFLLVKSVSLALSVYLWVSGLFLYLDLVNPPRLLSKYETSASKRLEVAVRRRMCRSLCTEAVWRRRLLEDLDTAAQIHTSVSLEEDLCREPKTTPPRLETRSLESMLDKMGYDWEMLENLSARREMERLGTAKDTPLSTKARKFLMITKNDILEAKRSKPKVAVESNDKATQTNTLSKKFLDAYSRRSLPFSVQPMPSVHSEMSPEKLDVSPIIPLRRKFSPVTLRPEMANQLPPPIPPRQPKSPLGGLISITIPPRFGHRHASTQVNNISRKYLEEQARVLQAASEADLSVGAASSLVASISMTSTGTGEPELVSLEFQGEAEDKGGMDSAVNVVTSLKSLSPFQLKRPKDLEILPDSLSKTDTFFDNSYSYAIFDVHTVSNGCPGSFGGGSNKGEERLVGAVGSSAGSTTSSGSAMTNATSFVSDVSNGTLASGRELRSSVLARVTPGKKKTVAFMNDATPGPSTRLDDDEDDSDNEDGRASVFVMSLDEQTSSWWKQTAAAEYQTKASRIVRINARPSLRTIKRFADSGKNYVTVNTLDNPSVITFKPQSTSVRKIDTPASETSEKLANTEVPKNVAEDSTVPSRLRPTESYKNDEAISSGSERSVSLHRSSDSQRSARRKENLNPLQRAILLNEQKLELVAHPSRRLNSQSFLRLMDEDEVQDTEDVTSQSSLSVTSQSEMSTSQADEPLIMKSHKK